MATVDVGGIEMWYEFSGEGETVVQIDGAVSAHEGYATITPELFMKYRVLDYDHRGHGLSDRPDQHYTIDAWSDDLAALPDALDIQHERVHGGSMGALSRSTLLPITQIGLTNCFSARGQRQKCHRMATLRFRVWQ